MGGHAKMVTHLQKALQNEDSWADHITRMNPDWHTYDSDYAKQHRAMLRDYRNYKLHPKDVKKLYYDEKRGIDLALGKYRAGEEQEAAKTSQAIYEKEYKKRIKDKNLSKSVIELTDFLEKAPFGFQFPSGGGSDQPREESDQPHEESEGASIPKGRRIYLTQNEDAPEGISRIYPGIRDPEARFYDLQDLKSDEHKDTLTGIFDTLSDELTEIQNSDEIKNYEASSEDTEKKLEERVIELQISPPSSAALAAKIVELREYNNGNTDLSEDDLAELVESFETLESEYQKELTNIHETDEELNNLKSKIGELESQNKDILDKRFNIQAKIANTLLHSFKSGFDLDGEKITLDQDMKYSPSRQAVEQRFRDNISYTNRTRGKESYQLNAEYHPTDNTMSIYPNLWQAITNPEKTIGSHEQVGVTKAEGKVMVLKSVIHESLHSIASHAWIEAKDDIMKDRGWDEDRVDGLKKLSVVRQFMQEAPIEILATSIIEQKYNKKRMGKANKISFSQAPNYAYQPLVRHFSRWALAHTAETSDGQMSGKKVRDLCRKITNKDFTQSLNTSNWKENFTQHQENFEFFNEITSSYGKYLEEFNNAPLPSMHIKEMNGQMRTQPDPMAKSNQDETQKLYTDGLSGTIQSRFNIKSVSLDKYKDGFREPLATGVPQKREARRRMQRDGYITLEADATPIMSRITDSTNKDIMRVLYDED